jgi:hypothetical protein
MDTLAEIRRHVETIATDRDFVVHSNRATERAIDELKRLTAAPSTPAPAGTREGERGLMDELKACPFCGSKPLDDGGWIFCRDCGVGYEGDTAGEQWNRRAAPASEPLFGWTCACGFGECGLPSQEVADARFGRHMENCKFTPPVETEAERLRREAHEALDRYLNETVQAEKHSDWLKRAQEELALRRFENSVCVFLAAARAKEGNDGK